MKFSLNKLQGYRSIMKSRYIYSILFGIPGLLLSLILAAVASGLALGVLWIFVFGDNPWPSSVENTLPALFGLVFLIVWLGSLTIGFKTGRRLEQVPRFNRKHILISIGATISLSLLIVLSQTSVGNLGQKSDDVRCSDFCSQSGYPASSMPPRDSGDRSCSCLDKSGVVILTVPIDSISPIK